MGNYIRSVSKLQEIAFRRFPLRSISLSLPSMTLTRRIRLTLERFGRTTTTLSRPIWRLYSEKSNSWETFDSGIRPTSQSNTSISQYSGPNWPTAVTSLLTIYLFRQFRLPQRDTDLVVRPRARPYTVLFRFSEQDPIILAKLILFHCVWWRTVIFHFVCRECI